MNTIRKAERTVNIAVAAATATGAMPVPFADAPLLIGEQVAMMATVAKIFGIDIKEDGLKTLAAAALGVGGAALVGKTLVSNILKFVPGAGWLIGGAISGVAAGAITHGIGRAFIEVCKAIQIGKMEERDIASTDGIAAFLEYFKGFFKSFKKSFHENAGDFTEDGHCAEDDRYAEDDSGEDDYSGDDAL